MQYTCLGIPVRGSTKAGRSVGLLLINSKSAACCVGFFGETPDAFTIPAHSSPVVSVAVKL